MNREPTTQTLTVLVVGDERSPMRRFQIPREKAKRFMVLGAAVAFLLTFALVDWARLRLEAVDVERLSAETATQRELVESVAGSLEELESELERLREFERKVRVIADLPESRTLAVGGPEGLGAQGGGLDPAGGGQETAPGPPTKPTAHLAPELVPESRMAQNHVHPAALGRVTRKARRLIPHTSARLTSMEDLVAQLDGKSKRLAATPSIWPAEGWLTSRFGYRVSPFTSKRQFHAGIDVAANLGTEIVAPAEGKVVSAGKRGALGKRVVIDHGYGVRTTYGHLEKFLVGAGDRVERGQLIASVGSTGRSTGPHLHYAVEVNGKARNPLDYILD
jgi:murein DD-endopeptidase MepM/ murein hydrolase activator NlpD